MKNYFLSATMIAISLLTFSCSNDDESIADANPTAKEIIVTEAKTVEGKSSNIKSEKSNVARVVLCSVTGGGSTLRDAVVVAQRKLSRSSCFRPNVPIDYSYRLTIVGSWLCTATIYN